MSIRCSHCSTYRDESLYDEGYKTCNICREQRKLKRNKAKINKLLEKKNLIEPLKIHNSKKFKEGICYRCSKPLNGTGDYLCTSCREYKKKWKRDSRKRQYLKGMCLCCGKPRENLLITMCNYCLKFHRLLNKKRGVKNGTTKVQ